MKTHSVKAWRGYKTCRKCGRDKRAHKGVRHKFEPGELTCEVSDCGVVIGVGDPMIYQRRRPGGPGSAEVRVIRCPEHGLRWMPRYVEAEVVTRGVSRWVVLDMDTERAEGPRGHWTIVAGARGELKNYAVALKASDDMNEEVGRGVE